MLPQLSEHAFRKAAKKVFRRRRRRRAQPFEGNVLMHNLALMRIITKPGHPREHVPLAALLDDRARVPAALQAYIR